MCCQLSSKKVNARDKLGRRRSTKDNTCNSRTPVHHTDRQPLSTARCRRAGSSATADTYLHVQATYRHLYKQRWRSPSSRSWQQVAATSPATGQLKAGTHEPTSMADITTLSAVSVGSRNTSADIDGRHLSGRVGSYRPKRANLTRRCRVQTLMARFQWRIQGVSRHPPFCLGALFEKNIF